MQFGMPTLIENHTLEENAALCEALGLRFIELNMIFPEYQVDRFNRYPLTGNDFNENYAPQLATGRFYPLRCSTIG